MKTAFRFRLRLRRLHSAYDLVKTRLSESKAEAEGLNPITKRGNVRCDWFILPLLLPTPSIWFSLDHKRNVSDEVVSGIGRKWKRSDSSDSDSVALMTPLTNPIFDFHWVISALTTPLTTPTPNPSLVKTSL